MKSSTTENPRCTRHGSLDSGSWSPAQMRLRLLTAPHHTEPSSTFTQAPWFIHYKTQAEVGQDSRSVQPSLQKCFSSGLTLAQPLAKFGRKHVLPPKMAENSCNNVKRLHSPVSGNKDSYLCRLGDNVFNLSLRILLKPWSSNYPPRCG